MFNNLPKVTKNILLINLLVWFVDIFSRRWMVDLSTIFGLHLYCASDFHFWQFFTYMFMHGNFSHIFSNMFAVLIFGPALENSWGSRRFLLYYLISGVGAAITQEIVWSLQLQPYLSQMDAYMVASFSNRFITIGASGAVFGILFAFGWLFPNVPMFIIFFPIPIRARVFVTIYALIELYAGIFASDNVAHFAHLGGMIFGWLTIVYWRHKTNNPDTHFFDRNDEDDSDDRFNDYHYRRPMD